MAVVLEVMMFLEDKQEVEQPLETLEISYTLNLKHLPQATNFKLEFYLTLRAH